MSRTERLARIAAKMSHPSLNVAHAFRLLTDSEVRLASKEVRLAPLYPAAAVTPDQTPAEVAHSQWLATLRSQYNAGLLH